MTTDSNTFLYSTTTMIINMTKPTIIRVKDDSFFKRGRMMRTSPLIRLLHKWMNTTHQ
jgi:hypothetical protein